VAANTTLARAALGCVQDISRIFIYGPECPVNVFIDRKSYYYGDHTNESGWDAESMRGIRNAQKISIGILEGKRPL